MLYSPDIALLIHMPLGSTNRLSAVILRVGEPYGEGFLGSVSNIILTCKLYQDSGTKVFALPYKKDEYFNTVHTLDIARAAIHAGRWYVEEKVRGLRVFNVVDHSDSSKCIYPGEA
jgi:hypothetical protein